MSPVDGHGNSISGLGYSDFTVTSSDTSAGANGNISPASSSKVSYDAGTGKYTLTLTDTDGNNGSPQTLSVNVSGVALTQTTSVTVVGNLGLSLATYDSAGNYTTVNDGGRVETCYTLSMNPVDASGNPVSLSSSDLQNLSFSSSDASAGYYAGWSYSATMPTTYGYWYTVTTTGPDQYGVKLYCAVQPPSGVTLTVSLNSEIDSTTFG